MSIDYVEVVRLAKKGRQAEKRGKALGGCVTSLITSAIVTALRGWLFMLAIGAARAHWWHVIPTIGYWWAVLFMALMPSFGGSSSKSSDT